MPQSCTCGIGTRRSCARHWIWERTASSHWELRFKHDPDSADGFVGAALSSNVLHIHKVRVLRHVVASSFKTDVLGVDLVELILSPLH